MMAYLGTEHPFAGQNTQHKLSRLVSFGKPISKYLVFKVLSSFFLITCHLKVYYDFYRLCSLCHILSHNVTSRYWIDTGKKGYK